MTVVDAEAGRSRSWTVDRDLALLDTMLRIRFFEEAALELTSRGEIVGALHPYTGHEAIAAGVGHHIGRRDQVISYYRCHGHALATGLDPFEMFAELLGRASGVNRGKGGSMHLAQRSRNFFGGNSIVGSNVGIAAGIAAALRIQRVRAAAIVFFGDGAMGAGVVLETLRIAQHQRLPLLLVCENNSYQDRTPSRLVSSVAPAAVAAGLGVPASTVDGNDVVAMADAAAQLLERVRRGDGPRFVEATTFLRDFHCQYGPMPPAEYRQPAEVAHWRGHDPVERLERDLMTRGVPLERLRRLREANRAVMREAATAALAAPEPDPAEAAAHLTVSRW